MSQQPDSVVEWLRALNDRLIAIEQRMDRIDPPRAQPQIADANELQPPRPMRECPKWNTCSVPICPLDPDWKVRSLLDNEPVCPWMLESVKPESAVRVFEAEEVQDLLPWLLDHFNASAASKFKKIGRDLARAATTTSGIEQRRAAGKRLARAQGDSDGAETTENEPDSNDHHGSTK